MVAILGSSQISKQKAINYILNKNPNPKISCSLEQLISFYIEEAAVEGVRWDIVLSQSILETGCFSFGGQVLPEQNNFCGLGALNNEAVGKGAWFNTPQIGIRAQVQHLISYCSTKDLTMECVDPRFNLVERGIATNLEDLGGKWAVPGYDSQKYSSFDEAFRNNSTYGQLILNIINEISKGDVKMNIIDAGLQFNGLNRWNNDPKAIVGHHTEWDGASVEDIHICHRDEKGWAGIGYHYYIKLDGTIYKGRPDDAQGAHVKEFNHNSLGVAFEGNYDTRTEMPPTQLEAWYNLKAYLNDLYGELPLYVHKEVGNSECPGKYFPVEQFKNVNIAAESTSPTLPTDFNEEYYLKYNNDVREAVERGDFSTGADHYLQHGYKENRKFKKEPAKYLVTKYLPVAYSGYNGVDVDSYIHKYFEDVKCYVRSDSKGLWLESSYIDDEEKLNRIANNLNNDNLYYAVL